MRFGDFESLCRNTPSYPWCNLFYRLQHKSPNTLTGLSQNPSTAPVGINPQCGIPNVGAEGSLGNIANIVLCGVSILFTLALVVFANRRKAAVGRVEIRTLFILYLISLPLQLITTGSLLQQGGTALTALTAIHAGVVAALFWALLANGLVATQIVEDGTMSSMVPYGVFALLFFAATLYVSLDVGFSFTTALASNPPDVPHSIPLFVLTSIWPAAASILYLLIMTYVVLGVLSEIRPMWFYVLSAILFVLAQLAWFLLGRVVCKGTSSKIDGSFIATLLETASIGVLYLAWKSITEESWDEDPYYPS